jgi:hypothetical protein
MLRTGGASSRRGRRGGISCSSPPTVRWRGRPRSCRARGTHVRVRAHARGSRGPQRAPRSHRGHLQSRMSAQPPTREHAACAYRRPQGCWTSRLLGQTSRPRAWARTTRRGVGVEASPAHRPHRTEVARSRGIRRDPGRDHDLGPGILVHGRKSHRRRALSEGSECNQEEKT